jgi:hypothetical protein
MPKGTEGDSCPPGGSNPRFALLRPIERAGDSRSASFRYPLHVHKCQISENEPLLRMRAFLPNWRERRLTRDLSVDDVARLDESGRVECERRPNTGRP